MTSKWYQYSQNNSASGGIVPYAAKFYLGRFDRYVIPRK